MPARCSISLLALLITKVQILTLEELRQVQVLEAEALISACQMFYHDRTLPGICSEAVRCIFAAASVFVLLYPRKASKLSRPHLARYIQLAEIYSVRPPIELAEKYSLVLEYLTLGTKISNCRAVFSGDTDYVAKKAKLDGCDNMDQC